MNLEVTLMSESLDVPQADVTIEATPGNDARNFDVGDTVFAKAIATVDGDVTHVGGFGYVAEIDTDENMVRVYFARPDGEDSRWLTAHAVEGVTGSEMPDYSAPRKKSESR